MIYRFSEFEFDTQRRELRKGGGIVAIPPKPLAVLEYLIRHHDRMISKSELLDAFWSPEVSEAALQTTIRVIRKALGRRGGAAIKTYHGQGFRFVAGLSEGPDAPLDIGTPPPLREQRLASVLSVLIRPDAGDAAADVLDYARTRIEADGGDLMHMMIDGFTAVFGLGTDAEDSARRAVICAWDLMSSDAVAGLDHAVTCGVETGQVIVADASARDDWELPGAIEREAARLARDGPRGRIALGETALHQLRDEIEVERTPRGVVLNAEPAGRAGIIGRGFGFAREFVGRDAELAFLATSIDSARSGTGQAVILSGPAGIGKSRLLREFLARNQTEGATLAFVQCLPRRANTPLAPIRQICQALGATAPPDVDMDRVDKALLARLLDSAPAPAPVLEGLSEHAIRDRSCALFVRIVGARCAAGPVVIVVEDAHWIDPASHAHLSALAGGVDALPLLMIVTTRPSTEVPLTERVLHLSPLGRGDCLALLAAYARDADLDETVAESLVDRAAGNPFFLEELAFAYHAAADPAQDLPDTIQSVMESRIAALGTAHRKLLYSVAIIGPPARRALVTHLLADKAQSVAADVEQLVQSGFLIENDEGIAFRHMLLHDTAYAMVAPGDRARMHGEVARLLEADPDGVLPETLAWHWQEAGDTDRALDYWAKASLAALFRFSGQAAITFAERGLALVDPSNASQAPREMRLQLLLAPALMARSGYGADDVGCAYRRGHALSLQTGSTKDQLRALLGLWLHTWVAGRLQESLSHANALLNLAERADVPSLRMQGHAGIGAVLMHTSDLDGARTHLDAGLRLIGTAPPETITVQNAAVTCTAYAAWVAALQGRDEAMTALLSQYESLSEALDNPFAMAIHLALRANILMSVGETAACLDRAERAVGLSRAQRYPFWLGTGLVLQGWAMGKLGDPERGLTVIDEGIAVFDATGAGIQRANWFGIKAEILLAAGRFDEGRATVSTAIGNAEAHGDTWFVARIQAVAAKLCEANGDTDAAAGHAEEAARLIAANGITPRFITV